MINSSPLDLPHADPRLERLPVADGLPSRNDFIIVCIVVLFFILVPFALKKTPIFSNDSYQYLSVSQNLVAGKGISTSIIHFDEQKFTGRIPAPQSVFPPGYSMLTALVGLTGIPLETAGVFVSMTSALALGLLMFWIGELARMPRLTLLMAIVVVAANSYTWRYARFVGTEAVFTATTLLSLGLLMTAENLPQSLKRTIYLLSGAAVAGFACWHRYAGYFLVLTVLMYYGLCFLRRRNLRSLGDLFVASLSLLPVAILLVRNRLISGGLRGTSTKPVINPIDGILRTLVESLYHFSFGAMTVKDDLAKPGILFLGLFVSLVGLGLLVLMAKFRKDIDCPSLNENFLGRIGLVALYFAVYLSGILYLAVTTPISFGERLLFPIFPVFVLLGASCSVWCVPTFYRQYRSASVILLAIGGICYSGIHLQTDLRLEQKTPHLDVLRELAQPGTDGVPLTEWIRNHIPVETVVMSLDGQATGYAIQRKTVSFVSREYSTEVWTEERTFESARKYQAEFLLIPFTHVDSEINAKESEFVRELLNNVVPSWLVLETSNDAFKIYKVLL